MIASKHRQQAKTRPELLREQAEKNNENLLRVLVTAGPGGLAPGAAGQRAGLPASTARAAMGRLVSAGLAVREGKLRWYAADHEGRRRLSPEDRADLAELEDGEERHWTLGAGREPRRPQVGNGRRRHTATRPAGREVQPGPVPPIVQRLTSGPKPLATGFLAQLAASLDPQTAASGPTVSGRPALEPSSAMPPAAATMKMHTISGREVVVPVTPPKACPHRPPEPGDDWSPEQGEWDSQAPRHAHIGKPVYCPFGCYRGGDVGTWRMTERGWRPEGSREGSRAITQWLTAFYGDRGAAERTVAVQRRQAQAAQVAELERRLGLYLSSLAPGEAANGRRLLPRRYGARLGDFLAERGF